MTSMDGNGGDEVAEVKGLADQIIDLIDLIELERRTGTPKPPDERRPAMAVMACVDAGARIISAMSGRNIAESLEHLAEVVRQVALEEKRRFAAAAPRGTA